MLTDWNWKFSHECWMNQSDRKSFFSRSLWSAKMIREMKQSENWAGKCESHATNIDCGERRNNDKEMDTTETLKSCKLSRWANVVGFGSLEFTFSFYFRCPLATVRRPFDDVCAHGCAHPNSYLPHGGRSKLNGIYGGGQQSLHVHLPKHFIRNLRRSKSTLFRFGIFFLVSLWLCFCFYFHFRWLVFFFSLQLRNFIRLNVYVSVVVERIVAVCVVPSSLWPFLYITVEQKAFVRLDSGAFL